MAVCNTTTSSALVRKDCASWPTDQQARWIRLFDPDDDFAEAPWIRQTQYQNAGVYTRYLACVRAAGLPDQLSAAGVRVFIRHCEAAGNTPRTIAGYLWSLYKIARILDPQHHVPAWLAETCARVQERADKTPKRKHRAIVSAVDLFMLGEDTIAAARRLGPGSWTAIQLYRDGLFLCFGALAPERLRALGSTKLGDLDLDHRLASYGPDDTKTKIDSLRTYPERVAGFLREWIDVYRAAYAPDHDHLWIAKGGRRASDATLAAGMRRLTLDRFGVALTPHRLRDGAATFLVQESPEAAPLATTVLTQRSERMTREYTATADQVAASRAVRALIAESAEQVRKAVRARARSEIALSERRRRRRRPATVTAPQPITRSSPRPPSHGAGAYRPTSA